MQSEDEGVRDRSSDHAVDESAPDQDDPESHKETDSAPSDSEPEQNVYHTPVSTPKERVSSRPKTDRTLRTRKTEKRPVKLITGLTYDQCLNWLL